MAACIDLTGMKFGRLTDELEEAYRNQGLEHIRSLREE